MDIQADASTAAVVAGSTRTRICTSLLSSTGRIESWARARSHHPPRLQADARLDAILRRSAARRRRVNWQLWRRPATLPAPGGRHGAGGDNPRQARPMQAWEERRSRCSEPAHAAFAGKRTVTPRSRDGMIEALRVLVVCRKTAGTARRIALQMIQNTIVAAPDGLRDQLRIMTRMPLVRTLAAWRPDLTAYRNVEAAYRISLKSLTSNWTTRSPIWTP